MLPIGDDNSGERTFPIVTYALIALNVLFFFFELNGGDAFVKEWAFVPSRFLANPPADAGTIFTSMFMHAGWLHLGGNMLYLWIFGDNVEDRIGRGRFVAFYLICGAIAALAQALPDTRSAVPMVGASGAVSGVLGAYLVLYPRANVLIAMPFLLARVPALVMAGVWFAGQLARWLLIEPGEVGVAFTAHVGGFIAGAVLVRWFVRDRRKRPTKQPS